MSQTGFLISPSSPTWPTLHSPISVNDNSVLLFLTSLSSHTLNPTLQYILSAPPLTYIQNPTSFLVFSGPRYHHLLGVLGTSSSLICLPFSCPQNSILSTATKKILWNHKLDHVSPPTTHLTHSKAQVLTLLCASSQPLWAPLLVSFPLFMPLQTYWPLGSSLSIPVLMLTWSLLSCCFCCLKCFLSVTINSPMHLCWVFAEISSP